MSGIQPWSRKGSTIMALDRPWTAIVFDLSTLQSHILHGVYRTRKEAINTFAVRITGNEQLIAVLFGHHDEIILTERNKTNA